MKKDRILLKLHDNSERIAALLQCIMIVGVMAILLKEEFKAEKKKRKKKRKK